MKTFYVHLTSPYDTINYDAEGVEFKGYTVSDKNVLTRWDACKFAALKWGRINESRVLVVEKDKETVKEFLLKVNIVDKDEEERLLKSIKF